MVTSRLSQLLFFQVKDHDLQDQHFSMKGRLMHGLKDLDLSARGFWFGSGSGVHNMSDYKQLIPFVFKIIAAQLKAMP